MQSKNRILDDLTRMTSGAMGTLADFRREVEVLARNQFDRVMAGMDMVSREEFETVRAMAEKARNEQEEMRIKIAALEAALAANARSAAKPPTTKPAPKSATARKPAARKPGATKSTAAGATKKP